MPKFSVFNLFLSIFVVLNLAANAKANTCAKSFSKDKVSILKSDIMATFNELVSSAEIFHFTGDPQSKVKFKQLLDQLNHLFNIVSNLEGEDRTTMSRGVLELVAFMGLRIDQSSNIKRIPIQFDGEEKPQSLYDRVDKIVDRLSQEFP